MNKKGAISLPVIILLLAIGVFAWTQDFMGVQGLLERDDTEVTPGNCPSSGLTEVTLNTQEALASTATNAQVDYFVFGKDGEFITTGSAVSGQSVFDLACGDNMKYDVLLINETTNTGYYGQIIEVDASKPTYTENLKMYEYGEINLVSVASSVDPLGKSNVSSGLGKTCGFVVTFTQNESASAFNKPLILCEANTTSVADISMIGVTEVESKRPNRLTALTGRKFYAFELDELYKSTDAAKKIEGKIQFSASVTPGTAGANNMSCRIVDQAMFSKADYQTLSLSAGFVTSSENTETVADIGAKDTAISYLGFTHGSGYC